MKVSQQNISAAKSREKVQYRVLAVAELPHVWCFFFIVARDQTYNWLTDYQLFCCASVNVELIGERLEQRVQCRSVRYSTSATRTTRWAGEEAAAHTLQWKIDAACKSYASTGGWKFPGTPPPPLPSLGCGPPSSAASWWEGRGEEVESSKVMFTSLHQAKLFSDPVPPVKVLKSARSCRRLIKGMEATQWGSIFSSIMSNLVVISIIPMDED